MQAKFPSWLNFGSYGQSLLIFCPSSKLRALFIARYEICINHGPTTYVNNFVLGTRNFVDLIATKKGILILNMDIYFPWITSRVWEHIYRLFRNNVAKEKYLVNKRPMVPLRSDFFTTTFLRYIKASCIFYFIRSCTLSLKRGHVTKFHFVFIMYFP